jgi:putative transposase
MGQVCGIAAACQELAVPRSWYYRQQAESAVVIPVQNRPQPRPAHALSAEERAAVETTLNSERFCDLTPRQVYAQLLDEDYYLCHWRTMYRILAEKGQVNERRAQRKKRIYSKPQLKATSPNQVWTWDITLLPGPTRGHFYYLYVILDMYSRYVVGWLLATHESAELTEELVTATCVKQGIQPEQLTLHADRGSAMRAITLTQLLNDLGVAKSHTRPYTPNDNPYSEAQFKTLKYRPDYPTRFSDWAAAHSWLQVFFQWYNQGHRHTNLALMTPAAVHYGRVNQVSQQRQQVLNAAYEAHPERFRRGQPVAGVPHQEVWINPPTQNLVSDPVVVQPEPGLQVDSKVGSTPFMDAEHRVAIDELLIPILEEKSSLILVNELSQNP